ncbi:hypothetical protein GFER_00970 [Geoalkalibacter ferrihydriticus DSM 17813]|uniref:Uncharacterized protein n=1 Tax=Geoalkalibacter ferrihydriticus DSM 17813 TaxID=1121915 RepID=A0A0C2HR53_9BACT|nr:hypothetical protein GFER_00970 [Geoalkalibacter ferrihydriticus DSM 17813]
MRALRVKFRQFHIPILALLAAVVADFLHLTYNLKTIIFFLDTQAGFQQKCLLFSNSFIFLLSSEQTFRQRFFSSD